MKTYYYLKTKMLLVCFTVFITSVSCSTEEDSNEAGNGEMTIETEILELVNAHRKSVGKQILEENTLANALAKDHTEYMIAQGELSHDNSEERGQQLISEEKANKIGENVASKYDSAEVVMQEWLKSSAHKNNIEGDYTHIGISAMKDANGFYYYTQIFLRK